MPKNYRGELTPDLPNGYLKTCVASAVEEAKAKGLLGKNAQIGQMEELTTVTASQRNIRYGENAIINNSVTVMEGGSSSHAYLNGDPSKSTPGLWKQSSKLREVFRKCIHSPGA